MKKLISIFVILIALTMMATAQEAAKKSIPSGSKVFINPITDEFDKFLRSAIEKKNVPLVIVTDKSQADFEISGASETKKASTAKKVIFLSWHSTETASINVVDIKSGETVWAYSVHKQESARGKQSTAEACAKHLKKKIEESKK